MTEELRGVVKAVIFKAKMNLIAFSESKKKKAALR